MDCYYDELYKVNQFSTSFIFNTPLNHLKNNHDIKRFADVFMEYLRGTLADIVQAQLLIRVHNFVQSNFLIEMDCSESFSFKKSWVTILN